MTFVVMIMLVICSYNYESLKKFENITNLIHKSFLFNERFMQRSVYIFMKSKFKLSNMPLSQYIVSNYLFFTQKFHKVILVYLFILCKQPYNNYEMTFFMYNRDIRKVRKRQHQYPEFGHTR